MAAPAGPISPPIRSSKGFPEDNTVVLIEAMKRMTEAMQDIATAIRETKPKQKEKGMKSEVLPPETLTPSCRNAAELAREIGRLVSREIGIETSILFMKLDMSDMEGNDVTISWKLGERT